MELPSFLLLQLQNVDHSVDFPLLRLLSYVPQTHLCG